MRKVVVVLGLFILSYSPQAVSGEVDSQINVELEEVRKDVNTRHPKRNSFNGVEVTRNDYVKTSNSRRKHWNRIREKDNLVETNVFNNSPKRARLMRTLSLEKKAGNIKGNFHKQKRR